MKLSDPSIPTATVVNAADLVHLVQDGVSKKVAAGLFAALTSVTLTGPITAVGGVTSVASQTGSGSTFVMSLSPTLTTPNIGAATGTSLTLSGAVSGSNLSGTNTGDQTSVSGNAGTATKLQTARNINGTPFDGTSDITAVAILG